MLKKFLKHIKENKTHNTHKTYVSLLVPYDLWLEERGSSLEWSSAEDITKYLKHQKGWNMTTGNIFLQSLKSYAKYALNHMPIGVSTKEIRLNLLNQQKLNQIKSFQYPQSIALDKTPKQRVLGMSMDDLNKFFSIASRDDKLTSFMLLYFCLRKNELLETGHKKKLMKVDFDKKQATFRVEKRKGQVTKTLYFDSKVEDVIREYLDLPVVTSNSWVNTRLKRYDKTMGYRIYPHLFRHVAISHMRRVLSPIYPDWDFLIKHVSGHTQNKDMTNVYTDIDVFEDDLRDIMTVNHWMNRLNPITW